VCVWRGGGGRSQEGSRGGEVGVGLSVEGEGGWSGGWGGGWHYCRERQRRRSRGGALWHAKEDREGRRRAGPYY